MVDSRQYHKRCTALLRVDAATSDEILTSLPRSSRSGRAGKEPLRTEYGAIQSDPHSGEFSKVAEIFCWLPSAQECSTHVADAPHVECREFAAANSALEQYLMSDAAPSRVPPALRRGAVLSFTRVGRDPTLHLVVSNDAANRHRWLRTAYTRFVSVVRVQWTAIPRSDDSYEPVLGRRPECPQYQSKSCGTQVTAYLDTLRTVSVDRSRGGLWEMNAAFRAPTGSYQRLNPQLMELLVNDVRRYLGMVTS
jgi:hypothetical protein